MMEKELILDNIKLVYLVLKQMKLYGNLDEWYDVGVIGLIKGVYGYDPGKGLKLSTFLCKCIRNEILIELRKLKSDKRLANVNALSLDQELYENDKGDDVASLVDVIPSDFNLEDEVIRRDIIENIFKGLNDKERYVIKYLYGLFGVKEKTQKEIAKELNMSQAQISRIHKGAIRKIRSDKCEYEAG